MAPRNALGLKNSIDRYRTFAGQRFIPWLISPTKTQKQHYLGAGVRFRTVDGEMFILSGHAELARIVDRQMLEYTKRANREG